MNWSWELWEWTAGRWRGRPVFAAMFPNSLQMCMRVHLRMCLRACVHAHWSLFSTLAKALFPAKSKVGGGCISTSLHYRERWGGGGGGGGWRRHFSQQDRKELKRMNTQAYIHTHTCTVWHLEKPQCVSTNLFPPKRTVPLLQAHHQWNLICYCNRHTHYAACCWRSQQSLNTKVKLPGVTNSDS